MPSDAATIEESLELPARSRQAIHADADASINTMTSLSFAGLAHSVPPLRPLADQQPPEDLRAPLRQSKMEVEAERSLLPGQNNKSPIECTRAPSSMEEKSGLKHAQAVPLEVALGWGPSDAKTEIGTQIPDKISSPPAIDPLSRSSSMPQSQASLCDGKATKETPMTAADKAKTDTEDKATSNQACEEDSGVEMLLMMRRRKGTDNVALPAPLSKAAIKTPGSSGITSGGLPSSHPYYRSSRVLASPRGSATVRRKPGIVYNMLKPDPDGQVKRPTPAPLKYNRLDGPPRYNSDVKYEQQQPRRSSGVVYHYPTAPQRPRYEGQRQEQVDRSGHLSPRVYIPPPIFSPRRVHSTEAIPSQSSLQSTRAEFMRPRSVASERAATMGEGSAAYRLQYLHQPYKPSTPAQPSSRELPKYPDYFGKGNEPLPSPIRESFVRSHPAQIRGVDATYREQHRSMRPTYKPSPVAPARPPLEPQGPHRDFSQDLRAHGRSALAIKRSAAELSVNQERHNTCVQQAAPHISAPQELAAQHQPKRARTDSAESSTSGSNGSPPNRKRYIAPPAGHAAGNQLIPYLSAPKPCDSITAAQQLRHGPAFRSPSPAYSAAAESNIGQGTVSIGNDDLRSLIAEVIEGKADRSKTETARTLADVAATLAKVAESLKQSMN